MNVKREQKAFEVLKEMRVRLKSFADQIEANFLNLIRHKGIYGILNMGEALVDGVNDEDEGRRFCEFLTKPENEKVREGLFGLGVLGILQVLDKIAETSDEDKQAILENIQKQEEEDDAHGELPKAD